MAVSEQRGASWDGVVGRAVGAPRGTANETERPSLAKCPVFAGLRRRDAVNELHGENFEKTFGSPSATT